MKIFLTIILVGVLFTAGCGVFGYDTMMKAKYETEELVVTLEKKGGGLEDAQAGLNIEVLNDPNGLLVLRYRADTRSAVGTSHDPAETINSMAELAKAFPADFWTSLARAAGDWLANKDDNEPNTL